MDKIKINFLYFFILFIIGFVVFFIGCLVFFIIICKLNQYIEYEERMWIEWERNMIKDDIFFQKVFFKLVINKLVIIMKNQE